MRIDYIESILNQLISQSASFTANRDKRQLQLAAVSHHFSNIKANLSSGKLL